uniref:Nuclear receptor domain-containing protein n=1 Tax=Caenorhabditis japonica TaxID=281687 RepID=A0A8R1I3X5_CAEJA
MRCDICSVPSMEYHFGVPSCRACAAFFRRYVNSPKQLKECNCETDRAPCRFCRMETCLKAGMMTSKVQKKRDNNPCRPTASAIDDSTKNNQLLQSNQLPLRSNDRISRAVGNYKALGKERKIVHGLAKVR